MIDKISGNSSYDYPSHNDAGKSPALQAYEHTPGKKGSLKQKSTGSRSTDSAAKAAGREQKGVILDLSAKGKEGAGVPEKPSWTSVLRRFVAPVIQWLKNFWESDTSSGGKTQAEEADTGMAAETPVSENAEKAQELPPLDEVNEIPDYQSMLDAAVKSGDLKRAEQILTQNGKRRLAHHSDLLTYYDRGGNLVELDDTERHRVLFGDKNIFRL